MKAKLKTATRSQRQQQARFHSFPSQSRGSLISLQRVAQCAVHEMDILLTWNCRHIANVAIQQRLRRLAEQNGYTLPSLATPEEFMSDL